MSLKSRLTTLRPGLPDSPPAKSGLAGRIDRLRASRAYAGKTDSGSNEALLLSALQGVEIADGVILVENRVAAGTRHGNYRLGRIGACIDDLPDAAGLDSKKLLFLDTETTGLCGGSGSLAFMVGMARLERGDFISRQYLLTRFVGERAMLNAIADWTGPGDLLVTYNGKSFDLPLLTARCRMAGEADPLGSLPHLDLLYPVRRAFSVGWDDCRLARVERNLLGFHRRNDLPGAEAPAAWFDWLRQGDGSRLPMVCRHNHWDLLSLALLLPRLAEIYRKPREHAANLSAIARAYRKIGREDLAFRLLLRHRLELDRNGAAELAVMLKRCGQRRAAGAIWMRLSAQGDQQAREQLAMHYEHDIHDYRTALTYANALSDSDGKRRRCMRLRHKLTRMKTG